VKDPLADLPAILQQKNQSVKFDVARIDLEELYRVLCRNRDKNPEDCYEELAKGCSPPPPPCSLSYHVRNQCSW
jgi:hypothetical protein